MSGHSHWATIKRKKGAADAKKGAIFTRLAREIAMAARLGGGDPGTNFRLELAIEKARAGNMPKDNIERAIRRGTGEDKEAGSFEELTLEGYGPHGAALMVDCVTDNRNRTISDLRHAFSKAGGNMAEAGAVGWQFDRKAYFSFPSSQMNYDKAFELAAVAGADDVLDAGEAVEIIAPVDAFKTLSDALHQAGVTPDEAELRLIAKQELELDAESTLSVLRLVEGLEELDDVQSVFHNVKLSDEALAALEAA
ncbi:MAG: putative transcriptional regulatory protein [Anaerolineaceae bacterium]|jgi:YebC/PmpR family DNA-binding regulatory protein|nr:YebC/PmpR family DNA-binding transcriptional regulator [Anaerolineae bacterium]MBL1171336.1 YebC/PmpR family DNA-binding transcriptional regulator [Chloroflexota bacterium]MBV6465916.1 putative transcriptional regulatory protein YebC [Anaerolineales bacterium]MCE7905969.1 YebC/PmpR family DNA-binding transcriptional regulator [Anaerolineae bacterium CFX3]MDL1926462.1 YebC/PmpR family DNA-binding transcriptional regulator [Anaerolineae bacterium AMX1]OQY80658.1 MAG: YebC/PmpR family DNA-bind